ncbi:hypothetical protein C7G75_18615 [Acinetobacter nosocomialis]|uniref:NACHT domain-containing protein n=2 Tax=Acinetobacter nosocomialis TaxID=106654 RepID=UPI000D0B3FDB|nr:hypothetical protein [Acinetobacter nosocomialis]PSE87979.1 hypothetical protein C7G75_18615 [Acinetobacter nosocomialis]
MALNFYLPRKLHNDEKEFTEAEVIASFKIIIILAEPGAGKTSLLESFSEQLNAKKNTANVFLKKSILEKKSALIIDALDELVRVDQSAIYELLGKAADIAPSTLILSSRSSEWEQAYSYQIKEFFEFEPEIFRLYPFSESEQQEIFENYKPDEDFEKFQQEINKYNLNPLLPNPQFLKLLADAYIQSNYSFPDRKSIFSQAFKGLAQEKNIAFSFRNDLNQKAKIELAEEIFAKIILSGAEGISTNDSGLDHLYPRIDSLLKLDSDQYLSLISTRLFKLSDNENQHIPIHKIVMEYGAANYLINKINSYRNNISLRQCLSIIAPNGIVRDELRGLVGWMAALGDKYIQESLIDIDPYAVIANGDPSQLLSSSKKYLLQKLMVLVEEDPFFRRNDMWRSFSIVNFFDDKSIFIIQKILSVDEEKNHLRGLILELLEKSIILKSICADLEKIVLNENIDKYIRDLACARLTEIENYDASIVLESLIKIRNNSSLNIASHIMEKIGISEVSYNLVLDFFMACTSLYPKDNNPDRKLIIGERYFIRQVVSNINYELIVDIINDLTVKIQCDCKKEFIECYCREGVSKVVGILLDRYFELEQKNHDPEIIWKWLKNLNFHNSKNEKDSVAVKVLQEKDELRQGIFKAAFTQNNGQNKNHEITRFNLISFRHAALRFKLDDYYFILDLAFEENNCYLWGYFAPTHQFYNSYESKMNYKIRQYAKKQAHKNNDFLRVWTQKNIQSIKQYKSNKKLINGRRIKNGKLKQQILRNNKIQYIENNQELIERVGNFSCLYDLARYTLYWPDRIEAEFGNCQIIKTILKNCISYIEPYIIDLKRDKKINFGSPAYNCEVVLYASCLEIFRETGNLKEINHELLEILRLNFDEKHPIIDRDEIKFFKNEVDRLLFTDIAKKDKFIKDYIEPQFYFSSTQKMKLNWLKYDDQFKSFREVLPLDWMHTYPQMNIENLEAVFSLCVKFCDQEKIRELVLQKCFQIKSELSKECENYNFLNDKANFWFIRAFFFLDEAEIEFYWKYLKEQEDTIFQLNNRIDSFYNSNDSLWPVLTPLKIWMILDHFVEIWPKVELSDTFGTINTSSETAYRFLKSLIWKLSQKKSKDALLIVNKLILDKRFVDMWAELKSIRSTLIRAINLLNFEAPAPELIVNFLDNDELATVESMRSLIIEELERFQNDLKGSETTSKDIFYNKQYINNKFSEKRRLNEIEATLRVADRLRLRLENKGITVNVEHQLKDSNRCDITFTKIIDNKRKLLVLESKGQWHEDLYNAASTQLFQKYSIHPDAEQQGIYFVLWFGANEKIANKVNHNIETASHLREVLETKLPVELKGMIDIFVLDVSLIN